MPCIQLRNLQENSFNVHGGTPAAKQPGTNQVQGTTVTLGKQPQVPAVSGMRDPRDFLSGSLVT
jgi:hypothetical protein